MHDAPFAAAAGARVVPAATLREGTPRRLPFTGDMQPGEQGRPPIELSTSSFRSHTGSDSSWRGPWPPPRALVLAIAILILGAFGTSIQAGSMIAINGYSCRNETAATYTFLGTGVNASNVPRDMPGRLLYAASDAGRLLYVTEPSGRQLQAWVSPSDWKARCSFSFAMEW